MTGLPRGWSRTEIGVVAETRLGKMLSKKSKTGAEPRPYLRNRNVQWGRVDVDDLLTMDFDADELERFEVIAGDLLVCEGGEIGRAAVWRGQLDWIGYQKALHRVRPLGGMAPEFLLYCFMWLAQSRSLEKHVTGSTIQHLPQEDLRRISIPLPPLDEQRRIVAAIEEHLSRLDAADASLAAAVRRIRQLRRATLADALSGTWDEVPIRDIAADTLIGLDRSREAQSRDATGSPYLRMGNIDAEGRMNWDDMTFVQVTDSERTRFNLRPGDLVFNTRNSRELVGKVGLVRDPPGDTVFNNNLMRIRLREHVDPTYAWAAMNGPAFRSLLDSVKNATTNVAAIYAKNLLPLKLPIPPLHEQRRIVARLEKQLSAFDALGVSVDRAQRRSASLRRATLEGAFRGDLVPQDPSDEPASVLLERIRVERGAAPQRSRRRRKTA